MTQSKLGELVVCSPTLISHFEAGRRKPSWGDAQRLDAALGTGDLFTRLRRTLEEARYADHFAGAADAEQQATSLEFYAAALVPGILQTPEYAREIFRVAHPNYVPDKLDELTVNRMARGRILDDPNTPLVWAILDEHALRRVVGGPAVMAAQLWKLSQLARSGRVLLQVLPFGVGAHAVIESMVTLFSVPDSPDLAYVEGLKTGTMFDSPADVRQLRMSYDLTRAAALPPDESLRFLESIAKEYDNAAR